MKTKNKNISFWAYWWDNGFRFNFNFKFKIPSRNKKKKEPVCIKESRKSEIYDKGR